MAQILKTQSTGAGLPPASHSSWQTMFRISKLTMRSGNRSTLLLPVIAFSLVTMLLLVVLAGYLSFFRWDDEWGVYRQGMAGVATTLLVVPLVTLGGSAARLSARRRDETLSTLRLLGASSTMVGMMAMLEAVALALSGAVLGVVSYFLVIPLVGLIPFRGAPLGAGSLVLNPLVIAAVIAGVGLIAMASAAVGLRKITISPLGVRTQQNPPKLRLLPLLIGVAAVPSGYLMITGAMQSASNDALTSSITIVAVFGVVFAGLNLIGPGFIGWITRRSLAKAQTPDKLVSARQILESPKAAWRQVSGVAMISFIAVFAGVALALASLSSPADAEYEAMEPVLAQETFSLTQDIRTGVILTVAIAFLMVACSVGVNQASQLLDRSRVLVSMDRLGVPFKTLQSIRRRTVLFPLIVVAVTSALIACILIFPITAMSLILNPITLLMIAGCLAAGTGLVWLSFTVTTPLLRWVLSHPDRA